MRVWLVSWDWRRFIGIGYDRSVTHVNMLGRFCRAGLTQHARKVSEARGYD